MATVLHRSTRFQQIRPRFYTVALDKGTVLQSSTRLLQIRPLWPIFPKPFKNRAKPGKTAAILPKPCKNRAKPRQYCQNRAKPGKTVAILPKPGKTGQNRGNTSKTGRNRAKPWPTFPKPCKNRAKPWQYFRNRVEPGITVAILSKPGKTGHNRGLIC